MTTRFLIINNHKPDNNIMTFWHHVQAADSNTVYVARESHQWHKHTQYPAHRKERLTRIE